VSFAGRIAHRVAVTRQRLRQFLVTVAPFIRPIQARTLAAP
jgi:hypothetical protein